jgi:hypothetical protein
MVIGYASQHGFSFYASSTVAGALPAGIRMMAKDI